MNIGIIGSGGREHALCQKIFESSITKKIFCFPGNAGTYEIAKNIDIDILNFKNLLKIFEIYKIDLVIIGSGGAVSKLVDILNKNKIKVFGPNRYASKLEGSKAFMKSLCKKNNIPTANFKICKNQRQVLEFIKKSKLPLVVKADGLAAGKGVTICKAKKQVIKISNEIFKGKFKSLNKIVLEEFIEGEEASYFLLVDEDILSFGSAQDHKRVGENDTGQILVGLNIFACQL